MSSRGWEQVTAADLKRLGLQAPADQSSSAKPAKYRNQKTNGFDSKKEAQRYHELTLMQRAGLIKDLACQVGFDLYASNGERVAGYVADFVYWDIRQAHRIVEDVKGGDATKTRLYVLKRKLLQAQGITITEV